LFKIKLKEEKPHKNHKESQKERIEENKIKKNKMKIGMVNNENIIILLLLFNIINTF
jgi:hypothetical protein